MPSSAQIISYFFDYYFLKILYNNIHVIYTVLGTNIKRNKQKYAVNIKRIYYQKHRNLKNVTIIHIEPKVMSEKKKKHRP